MPSTRADPEPTPDQDGSVVVPPSSHVWWESALVWGLMLSLLAHLGLAVSFSTLVAYRDRPASLEGEEVIVLGTETDPALTTLSETPVVDTPIRVMEQEVERRLPMEDLDAPFSQSNSESSTLSSGVESLTGSSEAIGAGAGFEGAGGEAKFFGVEARGSRFAFVVDVSGSMIDPPKIDALRSALTASVDDMLNSAHFCIILYSTDAMGLMGERWLRATDENKSDARRNIAMISPGGSTNPLPGFDIAFRLKPPPDAVYFMTDGVFSNDVEEQLPPMIERWNRSSDRRIPLHAITFVERGAEQLMRRLARRSGGSYTHVEGPRR